MHAAHSSALEFVVLVKLAAHLQLELVVALAVARLLLALCLLPLLLLLAPPPPTLAQLPLASVAVEAPKETDEAERNRRLWCLASARRALASVAPKCLPPLRCCCCCRLLAVESSDALLARPTRSKRANRPTTLLPADETGCSWLVVVVDGADDIAYTLFHNHLQHTHAHTNATCRRRRRTSPQHCKRSHWQTQPRPLNRPYKVCL